MKTNVPVSASQPAAPAAQAGPPGGHPVREAPGGTGSSFGKSEACATTATGARYWRGLDELAETAEFRQWLEREFPEGASEFTDPVSRRHFVKIMSASFLLAGVGLTGCRRPEQRILPFSTMPEHYAHGVPEYYATAMPSRAYAIPLIVKSNDGRPTKIESNAAHPDSAGTDRYAQASVLNLYDPDRAIRFSRSGDTVAKEVVVDFLADVSKRAQANGGQGLCFLMQRSNSRSRARLQNALRQKLPQAQWFVYEPVSFDIQRQAASIAFGRPLTPFYHLDQAKRIVSLDCDFLGDEEDVHRFIRDFAKGRKIETPDASQGEDLINRLYAVEALMTLTGANADHRLRVSAGAVLQVAAALAAEVVKQSFGEFPQLLEALGKPADVQPEWIVECAKDLLAHAGRSLVLAGHRQPLAVHLLAHAMNMALGNVGRTVVLHDSPDMGERSIADLAAVLNAGQTDTLAVLGGNPVYDAPAELDWATTQRKARTVIRLGYYEDETAAVSDWHLPLAHYLESWGDARTSDGTLVSIQPLIAPLFDGMTELELLARIGGFDTGSPYEIVRETFRSLTGDYGFEENWKSFLHDGFLAQSAAKPSPVGFNWMGINQALQGVKAAPGPTKESLEIMFHRDYSLDDGRYNNNGWLQELPDPITKLTWENAILVSLQTAREFKLSLEQQKGNEMGRSLVPWVKVELDGRVIEGPVWIQPGMADYTLGLALGYGRSRTGRVGRGSGYSAYALRTSAAPHIAGGAKLSIVPGKAHPLASTQSHWALDGRPIIREANLAQYLERPDFASAMNMEDPPGPKDAQGRPLPLYPNPLDKYGQDALHQWGMSIDLNACVGCSACMVACQSENNVPIVGKQQVGRSREMHWLRLDRYYTGDIQDPQVVTQPMLCQHCEAAPCESVCPVNATVHDAEGLNLMVYNRCVGTRYCSNNCPYKVRRFNYFDYQRRPLDKLYESPLTSRNAGRWELARWWKNPDRGGLPEREWEMRKLLHNPDVSVRMRGVMEKCTFCIQRIEQAKIGQKVKARASGDVVVPEGTFTTACAQACPAGAIVFGNLKDPNSRAAQLKKQGRDYTVLEFLLTKPRLTYLARVRNPNPNMPDYREMPLSLREYSKKHGDPLKAPHGQAAVPAHKAEKGVH